MSEYGAPRNGRRRDRRGVDPSAGRSAIGPRGTCPQCGRGLMPALEHTGSYCLACAKPDPTPEAIEDSTPDEEQAPDTTTPPTSRAYPVPMRSDLGHG